MAGGILDNLAVARWRLHGLRLTGHTYASATAAVDRLLGVQAENYSQATWAIASRTSGGVDSDGFDDLISSGEILRTHVLRPTWHFVRPDDIRWLLDLTGPRIRRSVAQIQRELGLSQQVVEESVEVVVETLSEAPFSRSKLGDRLEEEGIAAKGRTMGTILMHAESLGLICSGPISGGEQTYALLADRAPLARRLEREEAVSELAYRYFSGHGPATERDLSYWASMKLTDVRAGLESVGDRLASFDHDGRTFWHTDPPPMSLGFSPRGHLLQTLDEYHNGYQDSRHVLDVADIVPPGRPKNVGMALVDSQMVGGMRRAVGTDRVRFEVNPFRPLMAEEQSVLADAATRYGEFLDLESELVFV